MSQSDRVSRPMCYGTYTRPERTDRGCATCMISAECVQSSVDLSAVAAKPARSKYHREITKPAVVDGREVMVTISVDIYDFLHAWKVSNPALAHLVKKAMQPGQRGHKDRATDMSEIVQSAIRAKELEQ